MAINDVNQIDQLLQRAANQEPQRELYAEEKAKMQKWAEDIDNQNNELDHARVGIDKLKVQVKNINKQIDQTGKSISKTDRMADNTNKNIQKSNKTLKEILEKVGGPTNFCVDVILVCVCLGLIAVLYNVIKSKINAPSTTTTATTTNAQLRILFLGD